jgi:hypothetical protein
MVLNGITTNESKAKNENHNRTLIRKGLTNLIVRLFWILSYYSLDEKFQSQISYLATLVSIWRDRIKPQAMRFLISPLWRVFGEIESGRKLYVF